MAKATRREWAERVLRWKASGLTASEFAQREGVRTPTLRWWASALRREGKATSKFVDVTAMVRPEAGTSIELVVREVVRIRVSAGFDPELLLSVVAALEAR